jgi:hypothetical protein
VHSYSVPLCAVCADALLASTSIVNTIAQAYGARRSAVSGDLVTVPCSSRGQAGLEVAIVIGGRSFPLDPDALIVGDASSGGCVLGMNVRRVLALVAFCSSGCRRAGRRESL